MPLPYYTSLQRYMRNIIFFNQNGLNLPDLNPFDMYCPLSPTDNCKSHSKYLETHMDYRFRDPTGGLW